MLCTVIVITAYKCLYVFVRVLAARPVRQPCVGRWQHIGLLAAIRVQRAMFFYLLRQQLFSSFT